MINGEFPTPIADRFFLLNVIPLNMNEDNAILTKSFDFAVKVVNLYNFLRKNKQEFILSKQLVRSGTSIGANVNEAQAAQSQKDFVAKLSIASKEARESSYWIELLIATQYLDRHDTTTQALLDDIEAIIKLLTSIVKTCQQR